MKVVRFTAWLLLAGIMLFARVSFGVGSVPKPVMDARASLVRVFCRSGGMLYSGTGFAIGDAQPVQYIVTSFHVVEGDDVRITVMSGDKLFVPAIVFAKNEDSDICVLLLGTSLYIPPLSLEDGSVSAGDAVYALGFPAAADILSKNVGANAEDVTVTDGIVSVSKSGVLREGGAALPLIQTTAALSAGNSGGPLLDENGSAIGVNTLTVLEARHVNAAVGISELSKLLGENGIASTAKAKATPEQTHGFLLILGGVGVLAALAAILLLTARRKTVGMRKPVPFEAYFDNLCIPLEQKLNSLLCVAEQVRALNRKGRFCLDICPENISVKGTCAGLRPRPLRLLQNGQVPARTGYCAAERYSSAGITGPWTDVYAVCALVFRVMTGEALSPAYERTKKKVFSKPVPARLKPLAAAVTEGLSPDCRDRASSLDNLCAQLKALNPQDETAMEKDMPAAWYQSRWAKAALMATIGAFVLICAALFVSEINYTQAEKQTQEGLFSKAEQTIKGVPAFYRDTAQLDRYIEAAALLEEGQYAQAAQLYLSLGDYRDAAEMANEAAYLKAADDINAGALLEAQAALGALHPYKDSAALLETLFERIYEKALVYFSRDEFEKAALYFSAIGGYKQADDYKRRCIKRAA